VPPESDCPPLVQGEQALAPLCVALSSVQLGGDAEAGSLELVFTGANHARTAQVLPLLGPAELFAVTARAGAGKAAPPALLLDGDPAGFWRALVPPGPFAFAVEVAFAPLPSVELALPAPAADLHVQLSRGSAGLDETQGPWHGGVVLVEAGREAATREQTVTLRALRQFQWGSVTTFEYTFSVAGVREQQELVFPLLGDERIETLDPDRPFQVVGSELRLTVIPGASGLVRVRGHLAGVVSRLVKPAALPFEHWLFLTDPRHPVTLATEGREIDPQAVEVVGAPGFAPPPGARAFFLTGEQALEIAAIPVQVDEGRGGSGRLSYLYVQGEQGAWVGNLSLVARLPRQDRLSVRTPAPPHYAARGAQPLRMFQDEAGILSVQLDPGLAAGIPLRLQWRQQQPLGSLLSLLRLPLPEQGLHLDEQTLAVHLQPGHVPALGLGADQVQGHLLDGFHVFALLMGLLALVLCRAARLPWWLAIVLALLFTSLDTVDGFPRTPLFLLLAATAILVRLPSRVASALHDRKPLQLGAIAVWLVFLLVALVPSIGFVQERIHSALHPWDGTGDQVYVDRFSSDYLDLDGDLAERTVRRDEIATRLALQATTGLLRDEEAVATLVDEPSAEPEDAREKKLAAPAPPREPRGSASPGRAAGGQVDGQPPRPEAPAEKSMRPVALDQPHLPGSIVRFTSRSLLPGQALEPRLIVAGPLLRGVWIFVEAFLLVALLFLLLRGSRNLWRRPALSPSPAVSPATAGVVARGLLVATGVGLLLATASPTPALAQPVGPVVAPAAGLTLPEALQQLATLHRPPRWCAERCSSLISLEISGRMADGRLGFVLTGEVVGELPALVALFGTSPAAGLHEARRGQTERVALAWHEGAYVALLSPGPFRLEGELRCSATSPFTLTVPGPLGAIRLAVPDAQVLGDRRRQALQAATFQLVPVPPASPGATPAPDAAVDPAGLLSTRLRFQIRRSFTIARDRSFRTEIDVEGARPGAIVPVPLLPGEQVEGTFPDGAAVRPGGLSRVEFTAQDVSSRFHFFGKWTEAGLKLVAPEGAVRETWTVECSDPFSCTFEGDAERQPGAATHVWVPLPGQQLEVSWTELQPLPGINALVQTAQLDSHPLGQNLRQALLATWTVSAPTIETIRLPEGAVVTDFSLDGQPIPVLKDPAGRITLTLPAGRSELGATWEILGQGAGLLLAPPVPELGVPVGAVRHILLPPEERSVLLAGGLPGSPEVLLWPAVATCLLLGLLVLLLLRLLAGGRPADPASPATRLPSPLLLLGVFAGFAILSPFTVIPLALAIAAIRWLGWGEGVRPRPLVVGEVLLLLGLCLATIVLAFAVLHHAFFSSEPLEVQGFAEHWGPRLLPDAATAGELRWTAGLAGVDRPLPGVWALLVPTLAVRLVWFAWAILAGWFFFIEGRCLLAGIAHHWARAPWKRPAASAVGERQPAPAPTKPSKGEPDASPAPTTAGDTTSG